MNVIGSLLKAAFPRTSPITELGLSSRMRADYESSAPTGVSMSDIKGMEQFLIGVQTHSGQRVTPEKAKRCSAVLAIMRGLSEDVSCLPLRMLKHGPDGDEHVTEDVRHALLNHEPNDIMTALEMREHLMWDMMLWGNFFILKNEDPDSPGDIGSLWPLQAGYVTRRWREMVYVFTDPVTGMSGTFTPDLCWRGTVMAGDGIDGVAITLLAREAIGLLLAAEEQGARLFKQGVQTDMVINSPESLDDPDKDQLRKAFMERHAGANNAWMPLLLEGGLTATRLGLTAQESQYIEARAFQIGDIARIFRYPDVLLGTLGKSSRASTYASAEQFFQSYTKHTLAPWATRIEQTAHRDLLSLKEKKKLFFKHDFNELLRGDTAARYASYATGIASGFMSPADVRRKENMPHVPGLDYYTRPLNTTATAGGDAAAVRPTDVSGRLTLPAPVLSVASPREMTPAMSQTEGSLARRVAALILTKEHKGVLSGKQNVDVFYTNLHGFIEAATGANPENVRVYLETRRSDAARFSEESQERAITAIISLCKGM